MKFQYNEKAALREALSERRERALVRLNSYNERVGRDPYEPALHSCSPDTCGGSVDDPCARVLKHQTGKLGFIAEEVIELVPEAVSINAAKQPEGLSATAMLAVVVSAMQSLAERIESLEARLAMS